MNPNSFRMGIRAAALSAAIALLAACASVTHERAAIDSQAASARTAEQHTAIAGKYQSLAARDAIEARRLDRVALDQEWLGAGWYAGRFIRGHRLEISAQTRMQALSASRSADEAESLARLHESMASDSR